MPERAGPPKRQPANFTLLREMIETNGRRKELVTNDEVSYRKLGMETGLSPAGLYGIKNGDKEPTWETLVGLAWYFDDEADIWLAAGGFPIYKPQTPDTDALDRDLLALIRGFNPTRRQKAQIITVVREVIASIEGSGKSSP